MSQPTPSGDFARVERALHFIQAQAAEQPSLGDVAAELGLSEFHCQRLFQRWAGVSPKRFLQFLTLEHAKRLLQETRSVLEVSLEVGLSGPSRLHDLFVTVEGLTPGEYRGGAVGRTIHWSVAETPLGPALFAATDRGLCGLSFLMEEGPRTALASLQARWPAAALEEAPEALTPYVRALTARLRGAPIQPLSVVLKGTAFQLKVWEALLRIPEGGVLAYGDLARGMGAPQASRAVGAAVGQNPVACFIPCHRVIHATGALGNYHWGSHRKAALLGLERAHAP